MKGEKGYADREMDGAKRDRREAEELEQEIEIVSKKISVFKKSEHAKVDRYGNDQGEGSRVALALGSINQKPEKVIKEDGQQHYHQVDIFAPVIKKKARAEQERIAPLGASQKRGGQYQGQKEKKEKS